MKIAPLERTALLEATRVLAAACRFDRADVVAEEKLFGPGPVLPPPPPIAEAIFDPNTMAPTTVGAWEGDTLVGVAAFAVKHIRVLAVAPEARGRGVGSALLATCEQAARGAGASQLRALDLPGNYLAPGVDVDNVETIAWLERRGFTRVPEPRTNVLIDVQGNPRVTSARTAELADRAAQRGYVVRRARANEIALLDAVAREFGGAWPFELARALEHTPVGVHVALKDNAYCAFAAHDGNNRGLGWFGPTGTWPAHRGQGLGEALLLACLVDVGEVHAQCEVAWIGPRPFYEKVAGIARDRYFAVMSKPV